MIVYQSKTKTSVGSLYTKSPKLDTQVRKHVTKSKRAMSNDPVSAKRRKSCPQDPEQLLCWSSDSDDATIKTEDSCNSTDEEDELDDLDEFVGAGYSSVAVRVDDTTQIEKIIDTRLRQMMQLDCKAIAKPWIKAKEPQKQTKYPYNGGEQKNKAISMFGKHNPGELTKPPWWPSTEGWPNRGCRHKEPDHLKKPGMLPVTSSFIRMGTYLAVRTACPSEAHAEHMPCCRAKGEHQGDAFEHEAVRHRPP